VKRREFIMLLSGAAAAWPLAAGAQQSAMPVIGFLSPASPDANVVDRLRGFRQGLKDTGYVDGENVTITYRWAEGQFDRLPALATELLHRGVAVIAANSNAAAIAAKAATKTIPIVFLATEDPVKLGLVTNLSRPSGNVTGTNFYSGEVTAKRLELLRELVPAATRVAVLVNPANAMTTESTLRDVTAAASVMGVQIVQVANAGTSHEINEAFDTFARGRPDLLFVLGRAPRAPRGVFKPRLHRNRRTDELRNEYCGCLSSGRCLRGPYPQGRQTRGFAGGAGGKVRARYQRFDRQDARNQRAALAARRCRRGDRMM
jgi:ABC-type uncharacterized transport system substrate-binding protein